MRLKDLSIIELKAYYDIIRIKLDNICDDINYNGGNLELFNKKNNLICIRNYIEKEIEDRINKLIYKKDV